MDQIQNQHELEAEESTLLDSYETETWDTIDNFTAEAKAYAVYARNTFVKNHSIHIKVSTSDLEKLQVKALEEGLPFQALVASILHKYASGRLIESPTS